MARNVLWQEMRRGEIEEAARVGGVVIVPMGAIEQHGPHLPVNTDICDSFCIAKRAAERVQSFPVLVAPPIWWGLSLEHMHFPGTINVRLETLIAVITDVCCSIHTHGFRKIVLLNGHGGNRGLLLLMVPKLKAEGVPVAALTYWDMIHKEMATLSEMDDGRIGHSGEMETSLQLYLQPHLVDKSLIGPNLAAPVYLASQKGTLAPGVIPFRGTTDAPHGILGDPTKGTAAKGERIVEAAVVALTGFLECYHAL